MSYNRNMIAASRTVLSYKIELVNELLDELETELDKAKSNKVEPYIIAKATKRLQLLDELINTMIVYDSYVQKYLAFNPEDTSYLKDRLEVAKHYVYTLGGDWSTVVWGKRTDY